MVFYKFKGRQSVGKRLEGLACITPLLPHEGASAQPVRSVDVQPLFEGGAAPKRLLFARRRQSGAFMIELSLALIIAAFAAVGSLREMIRVGRMDAANIQADVLMNYKSAVDRYVQANYTALQRAETVTVGAVTLLPGTAAGQSLRPTIVQLRNMGYLDATFNGFAPLVDGGSYDNIIERTGCAVPGLNCVMDGFVYITLPVLVKGSADEDGPLLGQMMARIGGAAASSSLINPNTVVGGGGTFTRANPLGAQPGVFGVRLAVVDTIPYLRVSDSRDPNFAGNVTVGGNLSVVGDATYRGNMVIRNPGDTADCISLTDAGVITINCDGRLNAKTGVFTSGASTVTIDPATGVVSSVPVQATGFTTAVASMFAAADPSSIRVTSGDMFIKDGSGNTLVRFNGGNVVATEGFSGKKLALREVVGEGTACTVTAAQSDFAALSSGGIASCVGGVWRPAGRYANLGDTCAAVGAIAMDSATGKGLMCRGGQWIDNASATSKFVLMDTILAEHGNRIPKPSCPGVAGQSQPLVIFVPSTDAPPTFDPATRTIDGVDRYAIDYGTEWEVRIEATRNGGPAVLGSTVISHTYCYYP